MLSLGRLNICNWCNDNDKNQEDEEADQGGTAARTRTRTTRTKQQEQDEGQGGAEREDGRSQSRLQSEAERDQEEETADKKDFAEVLEAAARSADDLREMFRLDVSFSAISCVFKLEILCFALCSLTRSGARTGWGRR